MSYRLGKLLTFVEHVLGAADVLLIAVSRTASGRRSTQDRRFPDGQFSKEGSKERSSSILFEKFLDISHLFDAFGLYS
jgi:hypothetical protein